MVRGTNCAALPHRPHDLRLTPTIATSGRLITGVVTMPPSAPRLVMVMVEPTSSARVAVPCARRLGQPPHLGREVPQVARLAMAHHRHHQAGRRLRRDADMDAAVPLDGLGLVVVERVHLRGSRRSP